jgi:hypothetical protein
MGGKIKETWAPGYIIMGNTKGRKEKCQELIQWMRGVGSCCCALYTQHAGVVSCFHSME